MNQHAVDILRILITIALYSLVGSSLIGALIYFIFTLSFWHMLYLVPLFCALGFVGFLVYLRKTMNFPN